jgi:hypothetical protein
VQFAWLVLESLARINSYSCLSHSSDQSQQLVMSAQCSTPISIPCPILLDTNSYETRDPKEFLVLSCFILHKMNIVNNTWKLGMSVFMSIRGLKYIGIRSGFNI